MQTLYIHPDNPQNRLIEQVANALQNDKLILCPIDGGYTFAIGFNAKKSFEKLSAFIKNKTCDHFVLMCQNISQLSSYAQMDNFAYKILKKHLGQKVIFRLTASKFTYAKDAIIDIQLSSDNITIAILKTSQEPFIFAKIHHENETIYPFELENNYGHTVDYLIDTGEIISTITTLVDIRDNEISVIQQGEYRF